MEKTSNVFPVPWGKTLSRLRQTDGGDVLNESRYVYLIFLVFYWLVEFPALRLVLAYDFVTKNDMPASSHISLAAVRVLIALVLLPLFVVVWIVLVTWAIFLWTAHMIWTLPSVVLRDAQGQSDKQPLEQEKRKLDEGDDEKEFMESKKAKDRNEENVRRARKAKEDRVSKQVSLLINPSKLYQDKVKPYNEKIKALTLMKMKGLGESRKNLAVSEQSPSAPSQPTTHRSVWSFAKRGSEKIADDNGGV